MKLTLEQLAEYELRATMAERTRCAKLVPTNWCDPLLSGKGVNLPSLSCRDIEALLRGIQDRIRADVPGLEITG